MIFLVMYNDSTVCYLILKHTTLKYFSGFGEIFSIINICHSKNHVMFHYTKMSCNLEKYLPRFNEIQVHISNSIIIPHSQ